MSTQNSEFEEPRARQIIVSGGGIAGLTAAIALGRAGYRVSVFERASRVEVVGAGLQLTPNATRVLEYLGAMSVLSRTAVRPKKISLHHGRALRQLAHVPLGFDAQERWDAPYLTVHRADLYNALYNCAKKQPNVDLVMGVCVADFACHSNGVTVSIDRNGRVEELLCHLFVAADGVWSKARPNLIGGPTSRFSGKIAWRATIDAKNDLVRAAGGFLDCQNVSVAMHKDLHFVTYPVRAGNKLNMVAIIKGEDKGQGWAQRADKVQFAKMMTRVSPTLGHIARGVDDWLSWSLHEVPPSGNWIDERGVALIGDSAHGFTPFAAQGAGMAIEDGISLALSLEDNLQNMGKSLALWQRKRQKRVRQVAERGAFNYRIWHADGIMALGRNMVLKTRSPSSLAKDMDWLYGYDVMKDFA